MNLGIWLLQVGIVFDVMQWCIKCMVGLLVIQVWWLVLGVVGGFVMGYNWWVIWWEKWNIVVEGVMFVIVQV